jgi:hypothetical protein
MLQLMHCPQAYGFEWKKWLKGQGRIGDRLVSSTETTPQPEVQVSLADRLDLYKRNHERLVSTLEAEEKRRPKHEAILVITCLLAVSYTYPVESFDKNPIIEIAAISLKIPLRDAIAVFPTIIATLYLVFLGAALRQTVALSRVIDSDETLQHFQRTGELKLDDNPSSIASASYLFLPSPMHPRGGGSEFAETPRAIVDFFVGFVFTVLPYAAVGFITYRSWSIIDSYWIVGWDLTCMVAMMLSLLSAILSFLPSFRQFVMPF